MKNIRKYGNILLTLAYKYNTIIYRPTVGRKIEEAKMRISKEYEERRTEIIDIAEKLFVIKGYLKTTVNDILKEVGIAKGTFYYYFKSKEEVMDAIVLRFVDTGVKAAKAIVDDNSLTAHEKLLKIIMGQKPTTEVKEEMINQLHQINNTEMHHKSLVETTLQLSPVLVKVIEQGIEEGVFNTPCPKEVIEFLLVSSTFLFDEGIFNWQPEEMIQKVQAFIYIMEVTLGAEKGSLSYMFKVFGEMPVDGNEGGSMNDG